MIRLNDSRSKGLSESSTVKIYELSFLKKDNISKSSTRSFRITLPSLVKKALSLEELVAARSISIQPSKSSGKKF